MCLAFNNFSPDCSKLYTIEYNNKNYRNIHNAIFGRASEPYRFGLFKMGESYVLARYKDGKVLCIGEEGLEMRSSTQSVQPAMIQFMKVSKNTYALSIQNQGVQKYLAYEGYVLNEYYVGLQVSDSVTDLGVWSINEIPSVNLSTPIVPILSNASLNIQTYLLSFTSKIYLEPSLN
ncbi:MAG: hypothetical protein AB8B69_15825 [Chitinophagales bacterium]